MAFDNLKKAFHNSQKTFKKKQRQSSRELLRDVFKTVAQPNFSFSIDNYARATVLLAGFDETHKSSEKRTLRDYTDDYVKKNCSDPHSKQAIVTGLLHIVELFVYRYHIFLDLYESGVISVLYDDIKLFDPHDPMDRFVRTHRARLATKLDSISNTADIGLWT